MIWMRHRLSRDIDAFIDDPQYLGFLNPTLAGEDLWRCQACDRQANYLKLYYPEGEIDFIASPAITTLPNFEREIDGHVVALQAPVEIAVSKMLHRPRRLKARDIFDIATVDAKHESLLRQHLHHLAPVKADFQVRLHAIPADYFAAELREVAVLGDASRVSGIALDRVREIVESIPEPGGRP